MIKAKPKICDRILALFMAFAMLIVVLSDNMLRTYAAPADAFTITVADKSDNAISGATVAYEVTVDGASFTQRTVETGDDGRVEISEIADIDFTAQPTPVVKLSATITKADYKQSVLTDTAVTSTTGNVNVTLKEKAVDADFGFANPNPVINYDQNNTGFTNPLTKGNGNGNITFEIEGGKSDVASIDATNGELTINKTGTVTVTAKKAADENYKAAQASYTLTVKDVIKFDKETPELDFDPEKENTYTQEVTIGASLGVVKYKIEESTPSDAASIDESSGKVTITKPGKIKVGADLTIGEGGNPGKTFSASYILTVNKADQTGFAFEKQNPGAITYDPKNNTFSNKASSDQGEDNVTYEITSDNGVASIDSTTGILTILKAGDVTVKATRAADDKYNEVTAKYTLTINKADQTNFAFEKPNPEAVTYDPKNNTFSNKASSDQGADNVTYTITSDNGVASIDINGTLTILKAGTVTVQATRAADDKYKEATAEYTLTINKADQTNFAFEKQNPATITYKPGLTFENAATGGQSAGNVTYTITSGKDVASIDDSNGTLTINKAGTVTVKATRAADDKYNEVTAEYTLTINKADQTNFAFEKQNPGAITYKPGLTFENKATGNQGTGKITYEITSGNDVASIDDNGKLTINKAGDVTVKATRAADDKYKEATAEYTLTINKADQTNFAFENQNPEARTYKPGLTFENKASSDQGADNVTYTITRDNGVASIDINGTLTILKAGDVTVKATRAADDKYNEATAEYTLTINKADQTHFAFENPNPGAITYDPKNNTFSNKASSDQGADNVTYTITSGNDVASIDSATGTLTILKAGTVTVKAIRAGDDCYNASAEISYTLKINKADQTGFEFEQYDNDTYKITYNTGMSFKNAASGGQGTGNITYSLLPSDIVSIDEDGNITFNDGKVGTVTVTATRAADDKYNEVSTKYTLNISYLVTPENSYVLSGAKLDNNSKWYTGDITITPAEGYKISRSNALSDNEWSDYLTVSTEGNENTETVYLKNDDGITAAIVIGKGQLMIDRTAPAVSVKYDNNSADSDKYFDKNRTATITITEHNFDPAKVEAIVTVNGTVSDKFNADLKKAESWKSEGDVHTAKITFSDNADYTFSISCTDKAGHVTENNSVTFAEGSVATGEFTVDKTAPKIEVAYDNNSVKNGKYFKADRTATITITEHNFDVSRVKAVITDKNATDTVSDYAAYLSDPKNWTADGDKHTAAITFSVDADYTFSISCTDKAGNANKAVNYGESEVPEKFTVDKTNPENLVISYSESVLDIVLRTISFGFFNPDITVTVKADDMTSGIDYFTYSTDGNKTVTAAQAKDVKYDKDGKAYITFRIAPQYRGKISFKAFDRAGNKADMSDDDKTVVADNTKPVISVEYDNNKHDSKNTTFYTAKRTATIKITEANFFTEAFDKNYLKITVVRTDDNGKKTTTVLKNADLTTPFEDSNGNVHTAKLDFVEDGDYTFTINYTDFSGNKAGTYSTSFTIDKTRPTIDVSYDNNSAKNSKYFKADRTATITINEHNFDASRVVAKVTNKNATGTVGDYTAYLKNAKNWKTNGNTHTATIRFTTEADYTFNISYSDKAGNKNKAVNYGKSVAPGEFTIDKTAPTKADIRINNESVKATKGVAFEKFYRNSVTVKYSVNCDISGLDNITYQKVDDVAGYSADGSWTAYANTGVKVSPSEKFVIYFRAEDKAGNVTIINSTGIVVDSKAPTGETYAPEIDIKPEAANKNGLHNKDVSVDLNVIDPAYSGNNADSNGYYSGINRITYRISTTDTQAEETGVLFDVNEGITSGSVYDNDSLVSSWTGSINIDAATFNSNNVVVEITATDNAGNTRVTTNEMINVPIAIDVTKPEINISYNNNSVDSESLFKADRVATIAVTERNFKSDNVKIKITNTDGVIPAVSGWKKTGGTGNLDDTIWTATIPYTADGDYEFSIEYTDLADNRSDGAVYAAGTQAPEKFTVDKTLPVIDVSYDNNSASNGNYYNAGRTATIVITEHNFDASRVTVTLTATDDGTVAALPTVSGWTDNGDRHTATVSYSNDSLYTFDIAVKDKAGNDAADFAKQTFYVDKTAPSLTISGVADLSANSGEIIPVISYADTNYDDANVSITLTGAERKAVALDGAYSDQHNGKIFTFNNFPEKKEVDDIYTLTATLTDKAGNTTTKSIRFSANRFGSTYALPKATEELNGSYTQSGKDVVVTETNANQLKNIKVILFKNGETITLKEDDDYRIDVKGGNGQWYEYTYTVYSANFADDGVYRLSFSSEDDAGNKAENTLDTKNKEISFSVDKTKPDIVVTNIENGSTYPVDKLTVTMSASDNILLKTMSVYLDDYDKEYKTWTAEDIAKTIDADGNFTFDIDGNSTGAHKVKVVCTDAAGNEQTVEITDFYVTTNLFVRFYNNKVLFFGTIGGVIVIAAAIVVLLVLKKRKQNTGEDE